MTEISVLRGRVERVPVATAKKLTEYADPGRFLETIDLKHQAILNFLSFVDAYGINGYCEKGNICLRRLLRGKGSKCLGFECDVCQRNGGGSFNQLLDHCSLFSRQAGPLFSRKVLPDIFVSQPYKDPTNSAEHLLDKMRELDIQIQAEIFHPKYSWWYPDSAWLLVFYRGCVDGA